MIIHMRQYLWSQLDITLSCFSGAVKKNISPDRIKQELARRFGISGIEEKFKKSLENH